ncbi:hypothetical protein AB0C59_14315 [Streptomyces sp. NPDC048664]|uniref:SCO2583 family membrane protein n=1 Tax=Streptomyces sp. NPDC048664 TaxID=3154505 RepID=UPI0034246A97
MGRPGDPPEGTPEGASGGGEDEYEYRSVVFDESFVRAARLKEYSAHERMTDHSPAVRRRPAIHRGLSRQVLALVLLIAVAFGTAIYMGMRHPYQDPRAQPVDPARMTVIPLAPRTAVPGSTDAEALYAASPAARFRVGAEGVTLPSTRRTTHFSEGQVIAALATAKDYVVESSLDPAVLTGGAVRPVRVLVDAGQLDQFDRSFQRPAADGRHLPTGWLVRFDPSHAQLADRGIRVRGTLRVAESGPETLEVTADHVLVYALKPTGADARAQASLFTVRRGLTFRFDRDDLRLHQAQLLTSYLQAGPLACAEDSTTHLRPLLAGHTPDTAPPPATNPYSATTPEALCGALTTR